MDITVTKAIRKSAGDMFLSTPRDATHLDVAYVTIREGKTKIECGFSRYSTETEWYMDLQMTNGLPGISHGEGSRCCAKRAAMGPLKEALDNAEIQKENTCP